MLLTRIAALFSTRRMDAQLDDEVRVHLDFLAADYERRGMTPHAARQAARRAFGSVEPMKERYRDRRGIPLVSDLSRDVRFGVRLLIRDRWVTLTAALALALGIAATTTVFTITNTMLFRDLPFAEPDRIVAIGTSIGGSPRPNAGVSYADFQDWIPAARSFAGLGAALETTMNLADDLGPPERLSGAFLSANAFDVIGEQPIAGRGFIAADDRTGATPVVILGETTWRNRYRAEASLIGRTIRINGVPSTVVGVMREGFGFPRRARVWQPLSMLPSGIAGDRAARGLMAFGRLAPDATMESAQAELRTIANALSARHAATNRDVEPRVGAYRDIAIGGRARETMPLLLGIVVAVLLIACANVANLLLARAGHRAREVSVRVAVGASRMRIVRQLLVESVLLAMAAGVAGLALALAGVRLFWETLASGPMPPPYWLVFAVDWRVFAFFAVVCLGTGIVFGVVPALQASRTNVAGVLSASAASSTAAARHRWTNRFVVAQLALSPILLTTAGLMLRSIVAQQDIDPGVETAGLVRMRIDLAGARYTDVPERARFYEQLQERLAALPVPATIVSHAPFEGGDSRRLASGAAAALPPQRRPVLRLVTIGAEYFDTLGAPLRLGRVFTPTERDSGVVPAIVNERFVALHLPGGDPIGQQVMLAVPQASAAPPRTVDIVGVAPDIRQRSTESAGPVEPVVYVPYTANPDRDASILVRSTGSPGAVAALVREQLRGIDPDIAVFEIMTLDESLAGSDERLGLAVFAALITSFAAIGLFLATIGVYAVTAYGVAQRTREIGLRIALGARRSHVWWIVTRRVARQLLVGLSLGMAGALAVGQLLRGVLIGTSAADPVTLIGVVVLLGASALAASFLPARRAVRLDPVAALRTE